MNCKPGDIAIIVGTTYPGWSKHLGKVLTVHHYADRYSALSGFPHWKTDLPTDGGPWDGIVADSVLKPLPPLSDDEDVAKSKDKEKELTCLY